MLLCLHEEHAVAIAHGYAKVTGKPMGAIVHSNVGLMHATMAIFNAWCDRVPVLLLGATGPVDAAKRRPWIDWIHTAQRSGRAHPQFHQMGRPAGLGRGGAESVLRAYKIATTRAAAGRFMSASTRRLQESRIGDLPPLPERARATARRLPARRLRRRSTEAAALLQAAERPLILVGRVSRSEAAWERRVELAEALGAIVLTDPKTGAGFPDRAISCTAPPAGNNSERRRPRR